jgi:hypothetical protein
VGLSAILSPRLRHPASASDNNRRVRHTEERRQTDNLHGGQLFRRRIPEELYRKPALGFATMKPHIRLDVIKKGVTGRNHNAPPTDWLGSRSAACTCAYLYFWHGRHWLTESQMEERQMPQAVLESGMTIAVNPISISVRRCSPCQACRRAGHRRPAPEP